MTKTAYLRCELERIPPADEVTYEEWDEWCAERGIRALASDRRGWWSEAGTYIRDGHWIARIGGYGMPEVLRDEDVAALQWAPPEAAQEDGT